MAIADQLRAETAHGKKLDGYSVWLVFFDGEEAIKSWSASDSTYGSRHLAAEWGRNGTLGHIKAFILTDMIGDKDLDIQRESRSTAWLVDLVQQAAKKFGDERFFFQTEEPVEDDHLPFVQRGVPSIDLIDLDYGPEQQLPPHGPGHDGQDQRAQPGDRWRCDHGDDPADRSAVTSRISQGTVIAVSEKGPSPMTATRCGCQFAVSRVFAAEAVGAVLAAVAEMCRIAYG